MVKATKVGKARSFWRGFFLTAITFGIYGIYWNYKAYHEVFSQFDLDDEGKDEGLVWLILGILFAPLMWIYQNGFVKNANYVRQRLALPQGVTARTFLTLVIIGTAVGLVFSIAAQVVIAGVAVPEDEAESPDGLSDEQASALLTAFALIGIGAVTGVVLLSIAYAKLQRTVNEIWWAFDQRMRELTAPPVTPPSAPFGAASPGASPAGAGTRPVAPPRSQQAPLGADAGSPHPAPRAPMR